MYSTRSSKQPLFLWLVVCFLIDIELSIHMFKVILVKDLAISNTVLMTQK